LSFEVKIEVFEGPFDLLLQLIMKQELDIHQVPIAQITASYIEHLEAATRFDLDTATEFLLIAATLLLIKTRSLLPAPEEEPGAADETEGAREFLVERLIEYKKFQAAASWLESAYGEHGWFMPSLKEIETDYANLYPDPFGGLSAESLPRALIDLLTEQARYRVDTSFIAPIRISVAERIERVMNALADRGDTTFSFLVSDCRSKLEVIATFLAVLELYKRGEIALSQRRLFGEIQVKRREVEKTSAA
jgi:segregation and condensation protein A